MDTSWIETFEKTEKDYEMYYKENIHEIHTYMVYINLNNEIEKTINKKITLNKENKITKEELIDIIEKHKKVDSVKYKLENTLLYNFNLENDELKNYLMNTEKYNFIKELSLDDIKIEKTIKCFQKLNSIILLMKEEKKSNASTRRIRLNIMNRKTRRRKK